MSRRWESNPCSSSYQEDALPLSHVGNINSRNVLYNKVMLKPVEDKKSIPGSALVKIGFIIALIIAGIFISNTNPPIKDNPSNSKPAVLGESIVNEVKNVGNTFDSFRTGTTKKISGYVQEKKEQVASKAADFVYAKSINPVLEKFNKLPKSDQEKIKKELCK